MIWDISIHVFCNASVRCGQGLASVLMLLGLSAFSLASERPNLVIIVADDLGFNDVGYNGSEIMTPRLDSLAAQGVRLNRFYTQPTCSPTRSALMTGQSPVRLGIARPITKNMKKGLPLDRYILPQYFSDVGYETFMVGKWHLGHAKRAQLPPARGFDHFYGHVTGGIGYWDHVHGGGLDWQRNGVALREEGYSTHLLAEEAVRLIEGRDNKRPMLLYASFNAPHLPNEAPADAVAKYAHIADANRRIHAAMVTELDTAIGRIVDALAAQGIANDTLIWFLSDNGGLIPRQMRDLTLLDPTGKPLALDAPQPLRFLEFIHTCSCDGASNNAPYKRGKGSVFEGGVRVPSLVVWPKQLKPRSVDQMVTVEDLLPTVLEATNISERVDAEFDGASQWQLLRNNLTAQRADFIAVGFNDERAYYRDPWKLIVPKVGEPLLFEMHEDPTETTNIASQHPKVVRDLQARLESFPKGEDISEPLHKFMWDPDFFGGPEDREPWTDVVQD